MNVAVKIGAPLSEQDVRRLSAGDEVRNIRTVYTARDKAHQRFMRADRHRKAAADSSRRSIIYFVGPTPPRPGM